MPRAPLRLAPALLAVALATAASAQVNTERLRRAADADGLALAVDAAVAFATGNADYLRLGLGGRADLRRGPNSAFVVGRTDLSRADGRSFLDRSFVHARGVRALGRGLHAEAFVQAERNRQQRLVSRTLAGAGLRLAVVERDSAALAAGLAPMLEREVLDDALAEPPGTVVRLSTYLTGRLALSPTAAVTATAYLQPRADRPADLRLLGQAALEVGLTRAVRLSVRAALRVDSRPPGAVEPADFSVENALVLALPVD